MTLQEVTVDLNPKEGLETESKGLSLFVGIAYSSYPIIEQIAATEGGAFKLLKMGFYCNNVKASLGLG